MFPGNMFMTVGQELRSFAVLRLSVRETERGRAVTAGGETIIGSVQAILAQARPQEVERWRQLNHPVTHKIIMRGTPAFDVRPGDVFELDGRRFYNQTMPYNVGDVGHWVIFYCDERTDVV